MKDLYKFQIDLESQIRNQDSLLRTQELKTNRVQKKSNEFFERFDLIQNDLEKIKLLSLDKQEFDLQWKALQDEQLTVQATIDKFTVDLKRNEFFIEYYQPLVMQK